jgi:hypothetical protein
MVFYTKPWWKRLVGAKRRQIKVDVVKDIQAIREFLEEVQIDIAALRPEFKKLEELEKERKVGKQGVQQINLETQAEVLGKILEKYEFFQNDTDINGVRVKRVVGQFLLNAESAGLTDLVKAKKKDKKWWMVW